MQMNINRHEEEINTWRSNVVQRQKTTNINKQCKCFTTDLINTVLTTVNREQNSKSGCKRKAEILFFVKDKNKDYNSQLFIALSSLEVATFLVILSINTLNYT